MLYLRALRDAASQIELAARWLNDETMAALVSTAEEGEIEVGVRAFELVGAAETVSLVAAGVAPVITTARVQ